MGWADRIIIDLKQQKTVRFRPTGHSMSPFIESGDHVECTPVVDQTKLAVNDIVLCKVRGRQLLHFIRKIESHKGKVLYLIGTRNHNNGWIERSHIYGKFARKEYAPDYWV